MRNSRIDAGSFHEMNSKDLIEVNGGSTKIAAVICYIGTGICVIGAAIAEENGNKDAAAGWAGLGATFASVGTVLAFIPAP